MSSLTYSEKRILILMSAEYIIGAAILAPGLSLYMFNFLDTFRDKDRLHGILAIPCMTYTPSGSTISE